MNKRGDHFDYQIRSWILDSAIASNKKGTPIDKILSDAEKFYGFVFPENGKVESINSNKSIGKQK